MGAALHPRAPSRRLTSERTRKCRGRLLAQQSRLSEIEELIDEAKHAIAEDRLHAAEALLDTLDGRIH